MKKLESKSEIEMGLQSISNVYFLCIQFWYFFYRKISTTFLTWKMPTTWNTFSRCHLFTVALTTLSSATNIFLWFNNFNMFYVEITNTIFSINKKKLANFKVNKKPNTFIVLNLCNAVTFTAANFPSEFYCKTDSFHHSSTSQFNIFCRFN